MGRFVIDPPTLVRLVEDGLTLSEDVHLVAPNSLRSEALALLLARVREGHLRESDALALHERMTGVKIRLLGDRVSRGTAWKLAMAQGWDGLRDAEYIAVTRLQADALVAADPHLAARAAGIVDVRDFGVLVPN